MAIKINGVTVIADNQNITSTGTISATGNITSAGNIVTTGTIVGNVQTTGPVSTTGNVTAGNVSATGNVAANFFIGNGSQLTGIDATQIQSGTSNVKVVSSGGNVTASVGGTSNVLVIASSGTVTTGTASVSGNITGGNIAATNHTGTNVSVTGVVTAASTVGGVITGTSASVSGGVTAASVAGGVITGTSASVSGTVTAASTVGGVITGTSASVSGNVTGANLTTAGTATIGGFTISGNTIVSSGSTLTIDPNTSGGQDGLVVIQGNLQVNGNTTTINSNVVSTNDLTVNYANNAINSAAANGAGIEAGPIGSPFITFLYNNTANTWVSSGGLSAVGNITGGNISISGNLVDSGALSIITGSNGNIDLSPNGSGNVNTGANVSVTGRVTAASVVGGVMTGSSVSVTGAVTAASTVGGIITGSSVSVTGAVTAASTVGGIITGSSVSVTGSVTTGGDLSLTGNIVDAAAMTITTGSNGNITLAPNGTGVVVLNTDLRNGQANGVGNIGATSARFNQVFALASSAQYADLAEKYTADATYAPGTVVSFGGTQEVTISTTDSDSRVAGVISTNPSFRMNDALESEHTAMVALTGRVPTKVTGTVRKGDLMVSAGNGVARAETNPAVGTVIGKALADSEGDAVIEVVVGRF